ncbi:hypothetical protein EJ110_NYTH43204 [Nymphaea thermarum]|nr:hypothetical protein EJ110_NYTH43204 [Nymphaea thermarum]
MAPSPSRFMSSLSWCLVVEGWSSLRPSSVGRAEGELLPGVPDASASTVPFMLRSVEQHSAV